MFAATKRREVVAVNRGERDADTVISGGKHVNVESSEIIEQDIALVGDRIAAVGDVESLVGSDTTAIDAEGKYIAPGLIDGHLHSYHAYINSTEFAKLLLKNGTTANADGFYGQAIVAGMRAIEFLKEEFEPLPLKLILLAPAIAHHRETNYGVPVNGVGLTTEEMMEILDWEDCCGIEEPTHEPITAPDAWHFEADAYYDLCERAIELNKVVTGHAVDLEPWELAAYVGAGASTDHEAVTVDEAVARLRHGMTLLSRYGSGGPFHDTQTMVKAITEHGLDKKNLGFCSDLLALNDFSPGGQNRNVQVAINNGIPPITAIQGATITVAEGLRVDQELGSLVPGKVADLVMVEDLAEFVNIDTVIASGEMVVKNGTLVADFDRPDYPDWMKRTVNLKEVAEDDFKVTVSPETDTVVVRTIVVEDGTLVTGEGRRELPVDQGVVRMDVENDVLKAVMFDRHDGADLVGHAFVEGYGLNEGALGFSVNASRENVVVIGTNDQDMHHVVKRLEEMQGGIVTVRDGSTVAEIPMPLFGLQSHEEASTAVGKFERVIDSIQELGCDLSVPLASLEFICVVPQIPSVRLSEYGLFDLSTREQVDLILEER